jgi:hypothetical protein
MMFDESEYDGGGWKTLRWTWRTGQKIARIVQTLAGAMLIAASALAEQYDVADVSNAVRVIFDGSAKVALIAGCASVAFILFKTFMKGPKGFSASKNLDDGDVK